MPFCFMLEMIHILASNPRAVHSVNGIFAAEPKAKAVMIFFSPKLVPAAARDSLVVGPVCLAPKKRTLQLPAAAQSGWDHEIWKFIVGYPNLVFPVWIY